MPACRTWGARPAQFVNDSNMLVEVNPNAQFSEKQVSNQVDARAVDKRTGRTIQALESTLTHHTGVYIDFFAFASQQATTPPAFVAHHCRRHSARPPRPAHMQLVVDGAVSNYLVSKVLR